MDEGAELARARIGRRVAGKLRLERVLGVGGMGAVYEAVNEATGRRFAVKLIHPEIARDPAGRERIAREARAPNEIAHPGLADVYDAGTDDDGTLYLCMELLEGRSLREELASSGLTIGEALTHVLAALEPLAAAHEKGFVHRDLKPENVFVAKDRVKLLDFGLVRRTDATTASITGATLGTVHYMSPEQARGASQATKASDVWSVGVMLYEILAGRRPFEGESALDLMMKATSEAPAALGEVAPDVPAAFVSIVESCLAKDPSARPADAPALRARLSDALDALRASPAWARAVDHAHFAPAQSRAGVAATKRMSASDGAAGVLPTVRVPEAPRIGPEVDDLKLPSSGGTPLKIVLGLLALLLAGGAATAIVMFAGKRYDATHVAIGIHGLGNELDDRLAGAFDAELRRFGFLTTRVADLGEHASESLLEGARDAGAGHAVLLDLTSERVRDGLTSETGFFRQGLRVRVLDCASGEEVAVHDLVFGHEALAEGEVAQELVSAWVHSLGPQLVDTLYARPSVVDARARSSDVTIAARALELSSRASDVETIRELRTTLDDRCRQLGAALDAANAASEPRVTCHGDPCGETYLVGLTPDGAHALVQVESARPFVNFQAELRWAETEERLERVPLAGGAPTVLATAANFYGVGELAPGGTTIAVVEQGRGRNLGVVGVDAVSGERRVLTVLGARRAPSTVLPSPDGRAVLLMSHGQGVMVREGQERSVRASGVTGPRWVSLPALGVPHVLAAYARWTDQIMLLMDDGNPAIEPAALQGRFRAIAGARDGLVHMILSDASGCHLARFDPVAAQMASVTTLSGCVDQPRLLRDGRVIGIASISGPDDTPGDPEIVVVDPGSGQLTALTRGTFREANPDVAADGSRVVFERHLENPEGLAFDARRSVVCWIDP